MTTSKIPNRLIHEKSPYLLQHAYNPVDWWPWCEEAFIKAKQEDKPIFLSIGYSTCHWCHVMAHESFEDKEIAAILNENFISIKVDKEERPDIDSIYMSVCQAFTGSGGWPTSIFMSPEQKPFFAGTYFPKTSAYGRVGFADLLLNISRKWNSNKSDLLHSANEIIQFLSSTQNMKGEIDSNLITDAVSDFTRLFDSRYGGFGHAPKFPTPHNLLFLMNYYEKTGDEEALMMVETTLTQMYKGGIYDHIGFGFSRYSTDEYFLVPHFEKMLYDNALLLISYAKAYSITNKEIYKRIVQQTAEYVQRELTNSDGGFFSAQDADSDGVEGKYYVFDYEEIIHVLGAEEGEKFNKYYGITQKGNFEGKNIPNLLNNKDLNIDEQFHSLEPSLSKLYDYRKTRTKLHLDDKILTSWNSLMIAAFSMMYRIFGKDIYLETAKKACLFIEENLSDNNTLFVSYRNGVRSSKGFLDDYAFYVYALINLYEATLSNSYLEKATRYCNKAIDDFYDAENKGFYLYGKEHEQLIIKPKETYDGAIPSGNSVMSYNLVKLSHITKESVYQEIVEEQLEFMAFHAKDYPTGYSFYLQALNLYVQPDEDIVCVLKDGSDLDQLKGRIKMNANVQILETPTKEYKLLNDKTTFYICKNYSCLPPTNDFMEVLK